MKQDLDIKERMTSYLAHYDATALVPYSYSHAMKVVVRSAEKSFPKFWSEERNVTIVGNVSTPEGMFVLVLRIVLSKAIEQGQLSLNHGKVLDSDTYSTVCYKPDIVVSYDGAVTDLVLEIDGFHYHDRTMAQFVYERKRERELRISGYETLRFAAAEIMENPWHVAEEAYSLLCAVTDKQLSRGPAKEQIVACAKEYETWKLQAFVDFEAEERDRDQQDQEFVRRAKNLVQQPSQRRRAAPTAVTGKTPRAKLQFKEDEMSLIHHMVDAGRKISEIALLLGRAENRIRKMVAKESLSVLANKEPIEQPEVSVSSAIAGQCAESDIELGNISAKVANWELQKRTANVIISTRKTSPRAYEPWSTEEDELLRQAFIRTQKTTELAQLFRRQTGAIAGRLSKLGLK